MHARLKGLLNSELARAEFVVASSTSKKKQDKSMIENHRGQIIALRKALAWIDLDEPEIRTITIKEKSEAWIIFAGIAGILIILLIGAATIAATLPQ